ncbi:MAG: hypothetical protein Q9175_006466 [Cornicularia normoerica]
MQQAWRVRRIRRRPGGRTQEADDETNEYLRPVPLSHLDHLDRGTNHDEPRTELSLGSSLSVLVSAGLMPKRFGAVDNLALFATPPASPAACPSPAPDPSLKQSKTSWIGGMEGDEQRRRQYEQQSFPRGYVPGFGGHGVNVPNVQNLRGAPAGDVSDRFRQAQLSTTQPSTSTPLSAGAGSPHELGNYDYAPGQQYATPQIPGPQFQYQPEYLQDFQRQRQFPQYTSQLMYNVPQQAQPQSPYDAVSQYQSRQSAAQVLGSQFGAAQYYSPGHGTNVSGPAAMPQQYPTTAYPPSMQYTSAASLGRSTLASSYPTMGSDFHPNIETAASEQPEDEANTFAAAYNRYQSTIEVVNDHTSRGHLIKARESLLEVSQWLSENVDALRLTQDGKGKHAERIRIWDSFNICWLAMLQRQKDDTQEMLDSGRPPTLPQSLLPKESLEEMGNQLVSLCDGLEKHGLVDYQMGVSEQEIIESKPKSIPTIATDMRIVRSDGQAVLTRCIDLVGSDDENDEETGIDPMLGESGPGADEQ